MKNTAILLSGVLIVAAGGCAGSFSKVKNAVDQAPDWYESSRSEVRGEGYPDLASIPEIQPGKEPGKTLPLSVTRVDELIAAFESDPRAQAPKRTSAEIEAYAQGVRAEFAAEIPPPNFLTEEEIAAIRESFNVPRVTQGLRGQR